MPKIVLAKAARVPLDGPIRWPGYSADVDDATFDVLSERGVLADEDPAPAPVTIDVEEQSAPVEEQSAPVEDAPKRPKQAANLETWQGYARALGIDTKGMSKQEIIAATK